MSHLGCNSDFEGGHRYFPEAYFSWPCLIISSENASSSASVVYEVNRPCSMSSTPRIISRRKASIPSSLALSRLKLSITTSSADLYIPVLSFALINASSSSVNVRCKAHGEIINWINNSVKTAAGYAESGLPQLLQNRADESFCTDPHAAQARPTRRLAPHEEQ
jgi:hypothetical protein